DQGFAVGIILGMLSLIALICNALWIGWRAPTLRPDVGSGCVGSVEARGIEYPLYWLFALGATVASLFQVHLPPRSGEVNVNLGDPIAIIGGLIVLGLAWQARASLWRIPHLIKALGFFTAVLAAALIHSYAVYGPIDWAFLNRFVGWFILLAYF